MDDDAHDSMTGRRSGVPDIDSGLLDRYLAGACTSGERAAVLRWASGSAERATMLDALGQGQSADGHSWHTDASWIAARARLQLDGPLTTPDTRLSSGLWKPARLHRPWPRGVGGGAGSTRAIAAWAAVVVFLTSGVALWRLRVVPPSAQQFREFATAAGSRSTATLRDGTQILLGPATRLRVPADFGHAERTVDLEGEAFFVVVHDAAHSFAVRTAHTVTHDIGTTFVIRAYPGDGDEHVAVVEGEVRVGPVAAPVAWEVARTRSLRARDLASVTDSGVVVTHGADVAALVAWTQGRLAFKDTPLGDVARELGRTFDLDVTVADSGLAGKRVTAAFAGESVDFVLDNVTAVVGARYERTGRKVVIRRRDSGAQGPASGPLVPLRAVQASASHE